MKNAVTPPANIYEASGHLRVATPIPGAQGPHTSVVVRPDQIQVEAECKYSQDEQHYLRRDWQVGSWHLDLTLPRRVDPKAAHATLRHGVLVVMAPISEDGEGEARPIVE